MRVHAALAARGVLQVLAGEAELCCRAPFPYVPSGTLGSRGSKSFNVAILTLKLAALWPFSG